MAGLGFDISPQRLQRELLNNLDDDSMDLALPPRPAGGPAEDSMMSGASFQSSVSRASDAKRSAPPTPTAQAPPSGNLRDRAADFEAPTPRARGHANLGTSSTVRPSSDSTTIAARPVDMVDDTSLGLPDAFPAAPDSLASSLASSSADGDTSPGLARGNPTEARPTLASVLARNNISSSASSQSVGISVSGTQQHPSPRTPEQNSFVDDASLTSEDENQLRLGPPVSSTPKATRRSGSETPSLSHLTAVRRGGRLSSSPSSANLSVAGERRPSASLRSPTGEQDFISATDLKGTPASQRRPVHDLSFDSIHSNDAEQMDQSRQSQLPTVSIQDVDQQDDASDLRSQSRHSSSTDSEVKAGGTPDHDITNASGHLNTLSSELPTNSSPLANRRPLGARDTNVNEGKGDMQKHVIDSLKQHEGLEAGQRRRIISGETPRRVSRTVSSSQGQGTPAGPAETSSGVGSGTPATPFVGARMDRVGKANTFKAGHTPVPRRLSPLSATVLTPDRDARISSAVSEASSNDLMRPVHGGLTANTSFPGLGAADDVPPSGARVDGAALVQYLSKVNSQQEADNAALQAKNDELERQLNKALREAEALRAKSGSSSDNSAQLHELQELVDAQKEEMLALEQDREQAVERLAAAEEAAKQLEHKAIGTEEQATHIQELEKALETVRQEAADAKDDRADKQEKHIADLEAELDAARNEARLANEEADELEHDLDEDRRAFEEEIKSLHARIEELEQAAQEDADRTPTTFSINGARVMEEENEHLRSKVWKHEETIAQLKKELNELNDWAKLETDRANRIAMELETMDAELAQMQNFSDKLKADRQKLAEENNTANDRIDQLKRERTDLEFRLNKQDQSMSSDQKTRGEADNSRFDTSHTVHAAHLEAENDRLRERVEDLEVRIQELKADNDVGEKSRMLFEKVLLAKGSDSFLQTPKSRKAASFIGSRFVDESTLGEQALIEQLRVIQGELDVRNASVDHKMDRLDALRKTNVDLHTKLANADAKAISLLRQTEDLWSKHGPIEQARKSLKRVICTKCSTVNDASSKLRRLERPWNADQSGSKVAGDRSESAFYSNLEATLQHVGREWAAGRRDTQLSEALREDLHDARQETSQLEDEMRRDHRRVSDLSKRMRDCSHSSSSLDVKLANARHELDAVNSQLERKQAELAQFQSEVQRQESSMVGSPRLDRMQRAMVEHAQAVDRLRQEKESIHQDLERLHFDYQKVQSENRQFELELESTRQTMLARQEQAEEQAQKISELAEQLKDKEERLEDLYSDREVLRQTRRDVVGDVEALNRELRSIAEQSKTYLKEIERLRQQSEREKRSAQGQKDSLETIKHDLEIKLERTSRALQRAEAEIAGAKEASASSLKQAAQMHRLECKTLLLQIQYLNTKFMRESDLRADLVHQKSYLSKMVGGLERNEAATLQFMANIGLSQDISPAPKSGAHRFRQVAFAVMAVTRIRLMNQRWQQTVKIRTEFKAAARAAGKMIK